jgi:hypothetical protein
MCGTWLSRLTRRTAIGFLFCLMAAVLPGAGDWVLVLVASRVPLTFILAGGRFHW